jgi:hypothetical protein
MPYAPEFARRMPRLMTTMAIAAACILAVPLLGFADPGTEAPPDDTAAHDATAPAQAGQWIHVDPQTGKRVPAPPSAVLAGRPEFSTSHQGLVEKPAPGGGMMIDLQGRFRSAATATVGADGKPVLDCIQPGTAGRGE